MYTADQLFFAGTRCRCGSLLACPLELKKAPIADGGSAWTCSVRWTDPDAFKRSSADDKGQPTHVHDPAYPFAGYAHLGVIPKDKADA